MNMLALKEWSIVCKALEEGIQSLLLRKGGILEYKKGFEVGEKIFLLYPTLEHQATEYVQPKFLREFQPILKKDSAEIVQDKSNKIRALAKIESMHEFHDKSILPKLEKYHIWNEKYVNMRMNYNPQKPINALLLRVYKLPETLLVDTSPEWAGCKSWIDIGVSKKYGKSYNNIFELLNQSKPVINDSDFTKLYNNFKGIWN